MPKTVLNVNLNVNQGKYTFDSVTKVLLWEIGRIEIGKGTPTAKGNIILQSGMPVPDSNPPLLVKFLMNQVALSGVKVHRLDMYGEVNFAECTALFLLSLTKFFNYDFLFIEQKYRPFKGVKYVTKAGNFQIRT